MKKTILISLAIILVSMGCSIKSEQKEIAVQNTSISTIIKPTYTKEPISSLKNNEPTFTHSNLISLDSEINLFSSDLLESSLDRNNIDFSLEEVKAEIYFTSGAGGDGGSHLSFETNENIPLMDFIYEGETLSVCLIHMPVTLPITFKVISPENEEVFTKTFFLHDILEIKNTADKDMFQNNYRVLNGFSISEEGGRFRVDDYDEKRDGITNFNEPAIFLSLWLPSIPQLYGDWKIQTQIENDILEKTITLKPLNSPWIYTIPNLPYNPMNKELSHYQFNDSDQVIIIGTGFSSLTYYNIGIYRDYEFREISSIDFNANAANLIFAKQIKANENGEFYIKFDILEKDLAGTYYIIYDYSTPTHNLYPFYFIISTENKSKDFKITFDCKNSIPSRLAVGDFAFVSADPPDANIVRDGSSKNDTKIGKIQPLEKIELLDGPVCNDNYIWWKIKSLETGLTGWTSEGDSSTYWLVPLK